MGIPPIVVVVQSLHPSFWCLARLSESQKRARMGLDKSAVRRGPRMALRCFGGRRWLHGASCRVSMADWTPSSGPAELRLVTLRRRYLALVARVCEARGVQGVFKEYHLTGAVVRVDGSIF